MRGGAWSAMTPGPNSPQFFASAVLRDGRVFLAGGEYNGSTTQAELLAAEIYDPAANTWSVLSTPAGWTTIGDASCCAVPVKQTNNRRGLLQWRTYAALAA